MNFQSVRLIVSMVFLVYSSVVFAQLTINVISIPNNTPSDDTLYIAGNFNDWNPKNSDYQLIKNENENYSISISPPVGAISFKFTRGNWTSVEGDANGGEIDNRTLFYAGAKQSVNLKIKSWKDGGNDIGSASENVKIIKDFYMPQLNRNRRIWIYLPPDYDTSSKQYPVMYMHDGQNLFDSKTSFLGEWEIDESLNALFENGDSGVIIVGIDNDGAHRIDEYTPWENPQYGGGEGDLYVDFIIETLKPHIDSMYRTKSDRLNTGIMGSSLGGLISFYAAIKHQIVFSKAGIFSPSFWFSDKIYDYVEKIGKKQDMRFYFLGGEQESENLIPNIEKMVLQLKKAGFLDAEININTHFDGQHSEWYWKREFAGAYQWLFDKNKVSSFNIPKKNNVDLYPNPFSNFITLENINLTPNTKLNIYNAQGIFLYSKKVTSKQIQLNKLSNGLYFFEIIVDGIIMDRKKLFKY